jgi:hypothetical protein
MFLSDLGIEERWSLRTGIRQLVRAGQKRGDKFMIEILTLETTFLYMLNWVDLVREA